MRQRMLAVEGVTQVRTLDQPDLNRRPWGQAFIYDVGGDRITAIARCDPPTPPDMPFSASGG
jgi:hypothetical protein